MMKQATHTAHLALTLGLSRVQTMNLLVTHGLTAEDAFLILGW